MPLPDFNNYPLWINFAVFAAAAVAVWIAGTRVSRYADAIAKITGIGHMAVGLVLLGGVTSLPEIAVALFSSLSGSPQMAVNNLLGGVAMQKAILAGADAIIGKEALTVVVSSPALLLQAALSILLLVLVAAVIVVRDMQVFGIGIGAWLILASYVASVWMLAATHGRTPWLADGTDTRTQKEQRGQEEQGNAQGRQREDAGGGLKPVLLKTALAALAILAAGFLLSQTGDAIAQKTGLGRSFVGAVLLAFSTSLPEVSTVVSAMRLRQYEMAISDILGTNLFNVMLIFLVDAVYPGGPVLNEAGRFSLFAALLGIVLTVIYLAGLIERRNRTIARMGYDSLATLVIYGVGLFFLYRMR